jgi:surface antigen
MPVLFALLLIALLPAALVTVSAGPALATVGTNDYPSNLANAGQDSLVDPWGFYNRECVSFVAWRLNNDNGVAFTNNMHGPNGQAGHWGNAYQWSGNATAIGYTFDSHPAPGSVAQWAMNYHGAGSAGHVAYVDSVNTDGSIVTEDYNGLGTGAYRTRTISPASSTWPSGFIHIKDSPPPASQPSSGPGNIYVGTDRFTTNTVLYPNRYMLSDDNRFMLILQGDGNLVLYGPGGQPLWSSGTNGHTVNYAILGNDGNFVLYGPGGSVVWATYTSGATKAIVQDDGNFALYNASGTSVWSSQTGGQLSGLVSDGSDHLNAGDKLYPGHYLQSGRFSLTLQSDGNLVLYGPAYQYLWTSGTNGMSVAYATQQSDGNFVLYDGSNNAVWNSGTSGSGATKAMLQSDGNFSLNTSSGTSVWSTHSGGQTVNVGSSLTGGGTLWPNYYLLSPDTRFVLIQQSDGNLVLYDYSNNPLWKDWKAGNTNAVTLLQTDGNFVEYSAGNSALWYTGTTTAVHANLQNDGNFVLYNSSWSAVWQTNTGGH